MKLTSVVFTGIVLIGATTALADLNSGLIAYFPFEENANDASGNGNTGTANSTSVVGGAKGNALAFNGSAYVEVPDAPSLNLTNAITLQAWVKASSWTWNSRIFGKGSPNSYYLVTDSQDGTIKFSLYQVGAPYNSIFVDAPLPPANEWHMLTATYDGSTARIYVDATLVEQVTAAGAFTVQAGSLFMGNQPGVGDGLSGSLDEMRVYNRALSALEIVQLYYNDYGLVAYYPFEGNANDASGNGNKGTANGTSVVGGVKGNALAFDGSAYVEVPDAPSLNLTNAITLQAWVKASSWAWNSRIFGKGSPNSYYLVTDSVDRTIKFSLYQVGAPYNSIFVDAPLPPANEWHMLTATYDGSTARIYVDATLVDQVAATGASTVQAGSLFMGNQPGVGGGLSGSLDEMRIYSRALSASEIQHLYFYEGGPLVAVLKAVRPSFSNLITGGSYQLQVSGDLNTWTNHGSTFSATNVTIIYPEYWDVDNWGKLFFRLQAAP
jgi:hypothetical protein